MGLFGGLFNKSSKTNYETTNQYADNSANAAEGAIAASDGSTINIESLDKDVALGSIAGQQNVALGAIQGATMLASDTTRTIGDFGKAALKGNENVSLASIENANQLAKFTGNTIAGVNDVASRERVDVLDTTRYALQSQQGVTDKLAQLASGALERSQTPDSQVSKNLIWALAAVAAVVGLTLLKPRRS